MQKFVRMSETKMINYFHCCDSKSSLITLKIQANNVLCNDILEHFVCYLWILFVRNWDNFWPYREIIRSHPEIFIFEMIRKCEPVRRHVLVMILTVPFYILFWFLVTSVMYLDPIACTTTFWRQFTQQDIYQKVHKITMRVAEFPKKVLNTCSGFYRFIYQCFTIRTFYKIRIYWSKHLLND